MVKKLSCVSCGSLKRFPHTFTSGSYCSGKILAELEEKMHMQYQKTFRNIMHGPTTYSEPKLSLKWSNISLKVNLSLSLCWSKTG